MFEQRAVDRVRQRGEVRVQRLLDAAQRQPVGRVVVFATTAIALPGAARRRVALRQQRPGAARKEAQRLAQAAPVQHDQIAQPRRAVSHGAEAECTVARHPVRARHHAGRRQRAQRQVLQPGLQVVGRAGVAIAAADQSGGPQHAEHRLQPPALALEVPGQVQRLRRQRVAHRCRLQPALVAEQAQQLLVQLHLAEGPARQFDAGPGQRAQRPQVRAIAQRRQQALRDMAQRARVGAQRLVVLQLVLGLRQRDVQTPAQQRTAGVAQERGQRVERQLAPFGAGRGQRRGEERRL